MMNGQSNTVTGLGGTNNLVISNGFGTDAATIDLYGISTITNMML